MNAIDYAGLHSATLSELASAYANKSAVSKANADSNKDAGSSVTKLLKVYAIETSKDADVSVDTARAAMQYALRGLGVKDGTVKASGNHFAGFRKMLSEGIQQKAWDEATTATAQLAVASEEVKAKNEAIKEWKDHTAKWDAVKWNEFLIEQGVRTAAGETVEGETEAEVTPTEASAMEAEVRNAA